jgi:hypothetical protein
MSDSIQLSYDAKERRGVLIFPNGRTLAIGNVTEEQAKDFLKRHATEFQKRDCCLHTVDGEFTRDGHE